jgi:hypothetical protein
VRALAVTVAFIPVLAHPGTWTLPQLGLGRTAHVVAADPGFSFSWRAPPHVRQGAHGRWYLVRLHARLLLDARRTTFEAAGDLESSTNGLVCASDLVDERLVGDSIVYSWWTPRGLIEASGDSSQPVIAVDDTSACIVPAIRPGLERTQLRATGFGQHAKLVVLPDSGIVVRTRTSNSMQSNRNVHLRVYPPTYLTSGTTVAVRVGATGAQTAVSISTPGGPLHVVGSASVPLTGHVVHVFRLRVESAGTGWFLVRAGGERRLVTVAIH